DLAAPPRADVLAFELGVLALARLLLALQQARLENAHGRLTVLQLRALVLAGHDDTAGQVRDAHGRADLVDVLPARAAGPVGVDFDIFGVDRDLRCAGFDRRQHFHQGKAGLPAMRGVERRQTHEPVLSALAAQIAKGVAPADLDRDAFEARLFAGHAIEHVGPVAPTLGPAQVHA